MAAKNIPIPQGPSVGRSIRSAIGTLLGLATIVVLLSVVVRESQKAPPFSTATVPARSAVQVREADSKALASYGWVDRKAGIVRIPVDEAAQRVIAEAAAPATRPATRPAP